MLFSRKIHLLWELKKFRGYRFTDMSSFKRSQNLIYSNLQKNNTLVPLKTMDNRFFNLTLRRAFGFNDLVRHRLLFEIEF